MSDELKLKRPAKVIKKTPEQKPLVTVRDFLRVIESDWLDATLCIHGLSCYTCKRISLHKHASGERFVVFHDRTIFE